MYTMPQKLAETIALQQRLLREAMVEQAHMLGTSSAKGGTTSGIFNNEGKGKRMEGSAMKQFHDSKIPESYEWKVKIPLFHFPEC